MNILEKAHMIHRFWRYRLRSERSSVRFVLEQNLKGTTALDIGANKGIYTYWLAKQVGKKGEVIAFEPQPELGKFLQEVKSAFSLSNVIIENQGLSDRTGIYPMYRKKVGSGDARMALPDEPLPDGQQRFDAQITKLDDYVRDNNILDISFIKCDVEGHELNVFQGGERVLKEQKPILLFEVHHHEAEAGKVFRYLESSGYYGYFIHEGKSIPHQRFKEFPYRKPSDTHRNYIFQPKN